MKCAMNSFCPLSGPGLIVVLALVISQSVWADVRVNDDPPGQRQETTRADRAVAVDESGAIHVVWSDHRSGGSASDIYYASSVDGGLSFSANVQVNTESGDLCAHREAAVAVGTDGGICVTWIEETAGSGGTLQWRVLFARSTEGEERFCEQVPVSDEAWSSAWKRAPSMAVDASGNIHIVWEDARDGTRQTYSSVSSDGGFEWTTDEPVAHVPGATSAYSITPSITFDPMSGLVAVAYYAKFRYAPEGEGGGGTAPTVYVSRSTGLGSGFEHAVQVPDVQAQDSLSCPSIGADGRAKLYVAWSDRRNGDYDIWVSGSTDGGASFEEDVLISDDLTGSEQLLPSVSAGNVDGQPDSRAVVWVGYCDRRSGDWECYLARSFNSGQSFGPSRRPYSTAVPGPRILPSIHVDASNAAHCVWTDRREDAGDIYYHRTVRCFLIWDNDSGVTFNDPDAQWQSLYCLSGLHETTSPEAELGQALALADPAAMVVTSVQDADLGEYDLRDYDAVFVALGWRPESLSCGGTIESTEASQLVEYLKVGGGVFCEGNDGFEQYSQPPDTLDSLFAHYFGGILADTSVGQVDSIVGQAGTVFGGLRFVYSSNDLGPHTSIDVIDALPGYGSEVFSAGVSDARLGNGLGIRSVRYKAIYFSFALGALENQGVNTKSEVIERILDVLCPDRPYIELDIEGDVSEREAVSYCPGDSLALTYLIRNCTDEKFTGSLHLVLRGGPSASHYIASEACTVAARDSLMGSRHGDAIPMGVIPSDNYRLVGYVSYSPDPQSIVKGPVLAEDDFHVIIFSPVSTSLIPDAFPTIIPPGGGEVGYTAVLRNAVDRDVTVDVWTAVLGPVGPIIDPVFGPHTVAIGPLDSLSLHRVDVVPGWAPTGMYCYCLNSGIKPMGGLCRRESAAIWTQACFEAYKLP